MIDTKVTLFKELKSCCIYSDILLLKLHIVHLTPEGCISSCISQGGKQTHSAQWVKASLECMIVHLFCVASDEQAGG